ncbi:hypothetical protein [Fibrella forsythiae]|uniref:Uncharacterized protein n=1 Tax=Fibrella forsythiae TaxID=2817061 RepID=A0ABS3JR80_9BACT|nr:hypothetical protein [Fibrella forsythiae]MBO0952508.1 hypothetical protein [Fibrella forsythiae]
MEVIFKFGVGSNIELINTYGVVENNSTDKNMPDPAIENVSSFFYKAQRDINATERNSLNANQALELHLFVRKGGTDANPTGSDSGLTVTNGNSTKAIYKKLRAYVIGASGAIYYAPVIKNF